MSMCKHVQNNMSYAKAHACILVPWSAWAVINAVGHSLSAQSLISAKEEGERPLPPLPPFLAENSRLRRKRIPRPEVARSISHI